MYINFSKNIRTNLRELLLNKNVIYLKNILGISKKEKIILNRRGVSI